MKRPGRPAGRRMGVTFTMRLSPLERAGIRARAKAEDVSEAEFLRRAILRAAGKRRE